MKKILFGGCPLLIFYLAVKIDPMAKWCADDLMRATTSPADVEIFI